MRYAYIDEVHICVFVLHGRVCGFHCVIYMIRYCVHANPLATTHTDTKDIIVYLSQLSICFVLNPHLIGGMQMQAAEYD